MKNNDPRSINITNVKTLIAVFLALESLSAIHSVAEDAPSAHPSEVPNGLPSITAKWTPRFDLGYVSLSITNNGKEPIMLSGVLHPEYLSDKYQAESDIITPSVLLILPRGDHPPEMAQMPGAFDGLYFHIGPGESKIVKYPLAGDKLEKVKDSNEAIFSLSINDKAISNEIPSIDAKWIPHFELGYVTLKITNHGGNPITVENQLRVNLGNLVAEQQLMPNNTLFKPSIFFTPKPGGYAIAEEGRGPEPIPTDIAPGETKVIKLSTSSLAELAGYSSRATLSLELAGKDCNKTEMAHLKNTWVLKN